MRRTDKARSRGRLPARGEAGDAVATAERAERRVAARLLLEGAQARAVEELEAVGEGPRGRRQTAGRGEELAVGWARAGVGGGRRAWPQHCVRKGSLRGSEPGPSPAKERPRRVGAATRRTGERQIAHVHDPPPLLGSPVCADSGLREDACQRAEPREPEPTRADVAADDPVGLGR